MTLEELKTLLESVDGFADKVVYLSYPEEDAPALPFIAFFEDYDDNFGADNVVYYAAKHIVVALYTDHRSETTEGLIEAAFTDAVIYYTKTITYDNDEKVFVVEYEIEV